MTIRICAALTLACTLFLAVTSLAQVPGQNVNMVSGTAWPYGDPFLERQNEPTIAVSTRNAQHILAGANDYRTVDLNLPELLPGEPDTTNQFTAEPWLGQYISIDGGARWQSTLLPGYRQDPSCQLPGHSPLCGFTTAADPVIRAGTNGMFYYAGIAFDRGSSFGLVFVARFMDLNDIENGVVSKNALPVQYINTVPVAYGSVMPSQFLDKPWLAVDIPRGSATCTINVPQPGGGTVPQTIPAGNVYAAYANVTQSGGTELSTIYFSRSTNCGANWSTPQPISQRGGIAQGANIQIDPETGWVYVVWRVIHNGTTQPNDGIAGVASFDGGHSFTPPLTLVSLPPFSPNNPNGPSFFDQNTSGTTFRSTAFPTMAVADSGIKFVPGPIYIAWSQRGAVPGTPDARIMMLSLPGSVMLSTTGVTLTPFAVDNGAITNDSKSTFSSLTRGHQIMPSMTFNQGKLMLVYYDLRQDHTYGEFLPTNLSGGELLPDANGNFFNETRIRVGDADPLAVFTPVINDANPPLSQRRHTMDVTLAQSSGGVLPKFTYARVSRYDFGLFATDSGNSPLHQLKFNPPNLPMFMQGQVPFTGDYVDVGGQMFTLVKCGAGKCWTYNNPLPPKVAGTFLAAPKPAPASAVHYATWASNQDVIAPKNGDWSKHTVMPLMGSGSVYSPGATLPNCDPGTEGDRNQNVYSSRITQGLLVSSPQNSKPLSSIIERGFVVLVQNHTTQLPGRYFRMTIANQPVGGFASFSQLVPPTPIPSPLPTSVNGMPFPLTSIDVTIGAHSGISRTVFAVSSSPAATIVVNVNEITGLGGTLVSGGLSAFLVLNADGTVPANLVDPNGSTDPNTNITNVELYDPAITGPAITGPAITGPAITGPAITGPAITGNNVTDPAITGPAITGPAITGTSVQDPAITGPAITGSPVSDGTYTVTNDGNTGAALNVKLTGCEVSPCKDTPLQLVMSQIYTTPGTNGNCQLNLQQQSITLSNVPTATFTPIDQLGNPAITGTSVSDASINLPPGDTALVTIRGHVDQATLATILTQVSPVVVPQAIDSNNTTATTPPIITPLFITTASLADGITAFEGVSNFGRLSALGGALSPNCPGTWSLLQEGSLFGLSPASFTPGNPGTSTVILSGSPGPGTYTLFVQVQDCASPKPNVSSRSLILNVYAPIALGNPVLPTGFVGAGYPPQALVTGGTGTYNFVVNSGAVPPGLSLGANGLLSGTPTTVGTYSFNVTFADTAHPPQHTAGTFAVAIATPPLVGFGTQPANSLAGQVISPPVQVVVVDSFEDPIANATVTLSLGNNTVGAVLSGTTTQLTNLSGTATFSDLSVSRTGSFTLVASVGGVTATSTPFTVGFVPYFGQATDGLGDTTGGGTSPDLVWGSVMTTADGKVTLMVRYAAGTFNSSTTQAQFLLDTDQNLATGSPGSNAGCQNDFGILAWDYLVVLRSGFAQNQAQIYKATGGCDSVALLATAPVTIFPDGMNVTFPLSMLTNTPSPTTSGPATSGPWRFKVTTDYSLGNGSFSGLQDTMPNIGSAVSTASTPLPASLPSGMVAWWPADGYPTDIVGFNSTTLGDATYSASEVGQAFTFNGAENVDVANSAGLNPTAAITVDAWVYANSLGTASVMVKKSDGANGYSLEMLNGQFAFYVYIPTTEQSWHAASSTAPSTNSWYHVAGTYDGTQVSIYVNGKLEGSTAVTGAIGASSNDLNIGSDPSNLQDTGRYWNGMIDEVEIFNRALSATEIQAIYSAGTAGKDKSQAQPPVIGF